MLAVITVATAFTDQMAEFHHLAVPIATTVMFVPWALELGNVGWPRVLLILSVVVPNLGLTALGHVSASERFVVLVLAWVGVVGTRLENRLPILLALRTAALGIALDFVSGSVNWEAWTWWLVGIVLVLRRVFSREAESGLLHEDHIVLQRERLRAEAEARSNELASLLTVSRSVASMLEMQPLLDSILDALGKVVDYEAAPTWWGVEKGGCRQLNLARA